MANTSEHIKKQLIEALQKSLGVVSTACKVVGISRTTYYQYLKDDEDFKSQVENIEEEAIDFVESKLFEQIQDNNTTATIFYLKTKGKKRGYTEKQEIEHSGKLKQEVVDYSKLSDEALREIANARIRPQEGED